MSDSIYSYIDAPASAIELNTNKVDEIQDGTTYPEEKYPNVEAVKEYVGDIGGVATLNGLNGAVTIGNGTNSSVEVDGHTIKINIPFDTEFDEDSENALQNKVLTGSLRQLSQLLTEVMNTVEWKRNKVTSISNASTDTQYASAKCTYDALTAKEDVANKVTSIDAQSTDTQYASAKCLYELIGNINTALASLVTLGGNE